MHCWQDDTWLSMCKNCKKVFEILQKESCNMIQLQILLIVSTDSLTMTHFAWGCAARRDLYKRV